MSVKSTVLTPILRDTAASVRGKCDAVDLGGVVPHFKQHVSAVRGGSGGGHRI